jgi:DNA-3-methyladenine glycosylase II
MRRRPARRFPDERIDRERPVRATVPRATIYAHRMPAPPPPTRLVDSPSGELTLPTNGPFSLEESATFGFGHQTTEAYDGVMRLAFNLDGHTGAAGVEVRQDGDTLHLVVYGDGGPEPDLDQVGRQVARVLSVDHDGDAFAEVGGRDPVIAKLLAAAPGLRPPLFYSPYEAAAWSIISARRPRRQGAQLRERLGRERSTTFLLAGTEVAALPAPAVLAGLDAFPGIPADRIPRLNAVGAAALDGRLDVDHLCALDPDEAMAELQELPGIGPFYSALVVIRSCGLTDVLPSMETMALDLVGTLYDLGSRPTVAQFEEMAEAWRPFRTWATVLIRAAAHRVLPPEALPERERKQRRSR